MGLFKKASPVPPQPSPREDQMQELLETLRQSSQQLKVTSRELDKARDNLDRREHG